MKATRSKFANDLRNAMLKRGQELNVPHNVIYHAMYSRADFAGVGINELTYDSVLQSLSREFCLKIAKEKGATVPE